MLHTFWIPKLCRWVPLNVFLHPHHHLHWQTKPDCKAWLLSALNEIPQPNPTFSFIIAKSIILPRNNANACRSKHQPNLHFIAEQKNQTHYNEERQNIFKVKSNLHRVLHVRRARLALNKLNDYLLRYWYACAKKIMGAADKIKTRLHHYDSGSNAHTHTFPPGVITCRPAFLTP